MGMGTKSGIYEIVCTANGRKYIGRARHPETRWLDHTSCLRGNRHATPSLQSDWNRFGPRRFRFDVVTRCGYMDSLHMEHRLLLISCPDCLYNVNGLAVGPVCLLHRMTRAMSAAETAG